MRVGVSREGVLQRILSPLIKKARSRYLRGHFPQHISNASERKERRVHVRACYRPAGIADGGGSRAESHPRRREVPFTWPPIKLFW